ncbi:PAS domain S-box protein [Rhodovastum atsumiense]|uniref:histidine kinase n=1 Tax=Rhodovastum atsumiense TaxID=504468 RepID=A0A5M6II99_9PROT|nr:PAS domain S-box protein [Rhodovastum atsumiense]KAA5607996.1 PAS domain S-box protein [Rhodovastum atsumiense]
MPSRPARRPGAIAVAAALAVLVVAGTTMLGLMWLAAPQDRPVLAWVEHTHETIDALHLTLDSVETAEAAQRGFLLTRDPAYLRSYATAVASGWRRLAQAQALMADNPGQAERLHALPELLQAQFGLIARSLTLARDGNPDAALALMREDSGQRLTDHLRQAIAEMVATEQQLLQSRRTELRQAEARRRQQLAGAALLALAGLGLGGATLLRLLRVSSRARRDAATAAERQRLLELMDLAGIMVREFDGTIRVWSEGCHRLYGWTTAEAVGRRSHDLLQTVFPVPLAEVEAILQREGEWSGDLHHRTRDGREVIVAARKVLQRDATGGPPLVLESLTDITSLHRTEVALRESQAELRSVLDTAAEGIVVANAKGRILSVNRATLRMFGYDHAEDLVGRDLGVLMPSAEAARHRDYIAAHIAGSQPRVIEPPDRELYGRRRDGSDFPIDLAVSSFGTNGKRCLTGIIRDATARKQAEAALRDSEARLRLVQQVGGIAFTDRAITDDKALISPEYTQLYGLPPGQTHITLQEFLDLTHPEDRDKLQADISTVYIQGRTRRTEFRIRRPDGELRWVASRVEVFPGPDGKPDRVISAQQDITEIVTAREALAARGEELERRVAERTAALAAAEARFRAIFDSQFQFIALLAPEGTLLEVNRTALEAGGLGRAETIGRPFWETGWWPDTERAQLQREVAEAAQGAVVQRVMESRGADGRTLWVDYSLKPVRDAASGAIIWVIAEGRDITEQRDLSGQLAQAQKVQALGQLASGIAHDFNNVLQTVSGAAMLIERRPDDPEKARQLARTAINAASRGASITQRLLSFARRGELRTETIPTADLLDGVREVLAHTLGTLITVRTEAAPGTPPVLSDRGQLETALVNLGTNARDAMPRGGTLTFRATRADSDAPATLPPGDYVRIDVIDTGAGMDAETLARVTEPFFTTKPPGQGTGLGLPMVKDFAQRSGGALAISSTPGIGTTVSLWLRQAREETAPHHGEDNRPAQPGATPARILLVDDDELVRETLAAQLEDAGFATLTVSGGAEAVAALEAGEAVDALVSDLSMPGMSGVETIQKARHLRPNLPCFLLTGYVGERAALAAEDAFTLVRKPVAGRQLANRIEASLETTHR